MSVIYLSSVVDFHSLCSWCSLDLVMVMVLSLMMTVEGNEVTVM